ncbi:MAG: molybdopterin-dependent oxidoreductase [Nitrospinota bacterium]|nr:molybdopterin-dependent oxidoreductase [Nitrospinota bacterium]
MATEGLLALLAQRLNLPVRLVYSREDSLRASTKRHPFRMRYRIGADREGRLTALHAELLGNTGAYTTVGPGVLTRAATLATGPYACPNVLIEGRMAFTNAPPCGAMRGFGAPQVHFALESTLDILAARLGLDPLEIRLVGGYLESLRYAGQRLSLRRVAALCRRDGVDPRCSVEERSAVTPLDPETGQGIPHEAYTWGVQMAEVDVNVETGEVRVVTVLDAGKAINPDHVRAQIEGGVLIGLGFALKEEFLPGETRCFKDYRIPRLKDTPEMVPLFVEVPEPLAPFGAKAVAESAAVPTAPAILNAVADATGARITHLPATSKRVLDALARRREEKGAETRGGRAGPRGE